MGLAFHVQLHLLLEKYRMPLARNEIETAFFRSALAAEGANRTEDVLAWLKERNAGVSAKVLQVPLPLLRQWSRDPATGNIVHASGRFFSIEGINVQTNWGPVPSWDQPIINQPEIGFLGIMAKLINGTLHFLMQAKIEPGNLNKVQLSPTLQATKSNYSQVHRGNRPRYLEYFNGEKPVKVLLDQLQSEQGARFLRKRNRNMIVEVGSTEEPEVPSDFMWMTLGQIKALMRHDNIVNMDTRSVISGVSLGFHDRTLLNYLVAMTESASPRESAIRSLMNSEVSLHDLSEVLSWLSGLKSRYELRVERIPLRDVAGWVSDGSVIRHDADKYFSVIGVSVSIGNREVVSWDQPMIKPAQEGIIAFIVKRIHGVHHFLVQAKLEAGNFDIVELAPTVQCLTGNYRTGENEYSVPFLAEVLEAPIERIWYSAMQSEEGGRFFEEQNRNLIVEVGDKFPDEVPDNYCWMTLYQLHAFLMFNNHLNIAARSLIAAVSL